MSQAIIKAMYEISGLARQADVQGTPRVSITFDNPRDLEVFKQEVRRQLNSTKMIMTDRSFGNELNLAEFKVYGVDVRII